MPLQYFLYLVEEGGTKIEIFSKRLFGWCKDKKMNTMHVTGRKIEVSS